MNDITALIVLLSLVAMIFGISRYMGEPIISRGIGSDEDTERGESPWAGGPTGVSIGDEDIGKM